MHRTVKRFGKKMASALAAVLGKVMPRTSWEMLAQKGEFQYHKKNKWRQTEAFAKDTARLFEHFGFHQAALRGKTIIDLGAGSRLRTRYFQDAKIIAIEPLGDKFRNELTWSDLNEAAALYSVPAENYVKELEATADCVISLNVLDHCFAFQEILRHVHRYLKKDGMAFLSFDSHTETDFMHPLILTDDSCRPMFAAAGFTVERATEGLGPFGESYGHGRTLNYWLRVQH